MAANATATADAFSPTTATVFQPSATASASSTISGLSGPTPGVSYSIQGGATGTSGGTSTGTITCNPCCSPLGAFGFLPAWFGPNGLCPGAVDNSIPVTVWANFLTSWKGVSSDYYCVKTSFSLQMRANDYANPNRLYFVDPVANACPATSNPPPSPRPTYSTFLSGFIEVGNNFWYPSGTMSKDRIQPVNLTFCSCSFFGQVAFIAEASSFSTIPNNYASIKAESSAGSCSPFSQNFGEPVVDPTSPSGLSYPGRIIRTFGSPVIGNWQVTFTL